MVLLEAAFPSKRASQSSSAEASSASSPSSSTGAGTSHTKTASDDSNNSSSSDKSDAAILFGRYNALPAPDWSAGYAKRMQGIKEFNETIKKLEAITLEMTEKKKKNKTAGGSSKKR